ncbi:BglG family transcription antiterminator [Neobacillus sp. SM06]|uniref:BglG family transcription antiterminator n=1 Tax=Neobacillus sp. SM06 TaxID=3422492 RepID=UPI003D2C49A9
MQLDERSTILLKEILLTQGVKISSLEKKLKLSRFQVNYSLGKIDDWLSSNQMPPLKRERQKGIFVDQVVQETFPELMKDITIYDYVISDSERKKLIILLLLIREEPLSLFHLSSALKVSRNTVLYDLKGVGSITESFGLNVRYTRKDGYFIEGNELNKRHLIIKLVCLLLQTESSRQWFFEILGLSEEEVLKIRQRLERIEKHLKFRFTDEKLEELPFTLSLIIRRIRQRKSLEDYYHDLLYTEEYKAVDELLTEEKEFDERELLFITLQLLASSISSFEVEEKQKPELFEGIVGMVKCFENLACVSLQEKDELVNRLYLHLRPALYRVKYQLKVENPLLESVLKEHGELHHLVKKAVVPLEEAIGLKFPESESAYLTMLFGSWLLKQGEEISTKKMAVVVCPNGISVSKLLYETLRGLFPEIIFLDHISLRDFIHYPLQYDFVFSTTFLKKDKKLFLVKPLMSNDEKYRLKARVYQDLNGYSPVNFRLEDLIKLIEKEAVIKNKETLETSLQAFFLEKQSNCTVPIIKNTIKPPIEELITEESLFIEEKADTWQEAVRKASKPLLDSMSIKQEYIDAMIDMFETHEPYIIIAPKVAIPHARPEDGVNRLSMSLLKLEKDVDFYGNLVKVFIIIAAIDRSTHLRALMQLNDLLADPVSLDQLVNAKEKSEILSLISKYSK